MYIYNYIHIRMYVIVYTIYMYIYTHIYIVAQAMCVYIYIVLCIYKQKRCMIQSFLVHEFLGEGLSCARIGLIIWKPSTPHESCALECLENRFLRALMFSVAETLPP